MAVVQGSLSCDLRMIGEPATVTAGRPIGLPRLAMSALSISPNLFEPPVRAG